MNILFILQYYKIGGVQTVTHVLSNKFVQEGHNCNVLTLTPSKGEEIHPIFSYIKYKRSDNSIKELSD